MTHKEILQAQLLDIVFENRNKEYGAYALRRGYNMRLLTALISGLLVVSLLIFLGMMNRNEVSSSSLQPDEGIRISSVEMPKAKQPELPKPVVRSKPVRAITATVAQVKMTTPPVITAVVKDPMPAQADLTGKLISTTNTGGIPDEGKPVPTPDPIPAGNPTATTEPAAPSFIKDERGPEFPGGAGALKKFLSRYLSTPGELEAGQQKLVRVRFTVDKDGNVQSFEIVQSGGQAFDNEVIRICKKMPRWIPAIQNGNHVPVSYVLPVTFIGVEE